MSYPQPPASKKAVKRAGKNIAINDFGADDIDLVDSWRSSHGYVINTFQSWLKGHFQKKDIHIEFAQRLKRKRTVIDKIKRVKEDGTPLVKDITSMHDLAGCRMIFNSTNDLYSFREYLHSTNVMRNVDHELKHEPDKFDYIKKPKFSGYRGVHDVYRHFPRGHRRDEVAKKPWDGLLVEIQYRTRTQHAWATAVEISDLIDDEKTKFAINAGKRGQFFILASEILARNYEGIHNALPELTDENLINNLKNLEDELGILQRLSIMRKFEDNQNLKKHNVLNIIEINGDLSLQVFPFSSPQDAILKATELENDETSLNAVYVRSDNPNQLRSAYRNYFNDPVDFVELLNNVISD